MLFTGFLVSGNSLIPQVFAGHHNSTNTLYSGNQPFQSAEINIINITDGVPISDPLFVNTFVTFEPNTNSTWQYREHNAGGTDSGLMWLLNCNLFTPDVECEVTTLDGLQLLDLTNAGSASIETTGSDWYIFKSFNVSPKFINSMTWEVVGGITSDTGVDTGIMTWEVRDGTYNRSSASDFPTGLPVPLKGAGVLQLFETQVGTGLHSFAIDPVAMANTQTDTFTLMGRYQQCDGCSNVVNIQRIKFDDWVVWEFNDPTATKTREVIDTTGDFGVANGFVTVLGTGGVDVVNQLGFAIDPTDNTAYGIYKTLERNADRMLATIDLVTGVTTQVGFITESVTGLEFKHNGELRAICGNGCFIDAVGTFYDIDKTNGDKTKLCEIIVPSAQGMELAFDQDNEIMYLVGSNAGTAVYHTIDSEINGANCATTNIGISGYGVVIPEVTAMAYNTNDNLFYGIFGGNAGSYDFFSQATSGFRTLIAVDPFAGDTQKGMSFDYLIIPPDAVPPVISAIGSEPVQLSEGQGFFIFDFVQCVDDVDGTIPNGANFALNGGLTVDPDVIGSQSQSFTCTDTATNNTIEVIDFFVNRANSGGGGSFNGGGSGGIETDVSQLSDVPPLTQPTTPPTDVGRALSIFDRLNSFFDFDRTPEQATPDAPTTPSLPDAVPETVQDQRDSFVDRLRDFFSDFFG